MRSFRRPSPRSGPLCAQTAAVQGSESGDGWGQCGAGRLEVAEPRMWVQYRRRPTLPEAKEWTKRFRRKSCVANTGIALHTSQFGNAEGRNFSAEGPDGVITTPG